MRTSHGRSRPASRGEPLPQERSLERSRYVPSHIPGCLPIPGLRTFRIPRDEQLGTRVFLYRNLHQGGWSLKAEDGPNQGRVIAHVIFAVLRDCSFHVRERGRRRVLAERRKNVHAGIRGTLVSFDDPGPPPAGWKSVFYNPYVTNGFRAGGPLEPVLSTAPEVRIYPKHIWTEAP